MPKLIKPNFFIVGAPKCGTTSLHDYLSQHPEIFMSKKKELNFFNEEAREYYHYKDEKEYLLFFSQVRNEKIIGESSAWYLYSTNSAASIYRFNKMAKILIILRTPEEAIPSLHSEMLYGSMESERDLLKALKLESVRIRGNYKRFPIKTPERTHYMKVYNYPSQIKKYLNYFSKNNIKIILFDQLKSETLKTYQEILEFLNVQNEFIPDISIKNSNREVLSLKLQRLINSSSTLKENLKKILPAYYRRNIKMLARKINTSYLSRKEISVEERQYIYENTTDMVHELDKLLHCECLIESKLNLIKVWGY